MPMRSPHCPGAASRARALGAAAWLTLAAGCASPPSAPTVVDWVIARPRPACDPGAPPEAMRWAIERLLTRGLVDEDSSGSIVPAAAQRYEVSDDGRVYTFHLAPALVFADSSPCVSADFRRALEAGLERTDHATQAWLLGSVIGVDRVRPGRVPDLGIETPDDRTLVLRLSRPDSLLLRKLALPGVSAPWSPRSGGADWDGMRGLGPYRVVSADGERMTLARFAGCSWGRFGGSDTLRLRFATNEARVRALLRAGRADLLWPTPPGMIGEALPRRYRRARRGRRAPPGRLPRGAAGRRSAAVPAAGDARGRAAALAAGREAGAVARAESSGHPARAGSRRPRPRGLDLRGAGLRVPAARHPCGQRLDVPRSIRPLVPRRHGLRRRRDG